MVGLTLNQKIKRAFLKVLTHWVRDTGLANYEVGARLAARLPEVAFWANINGQATRLQIDDVQVGFEGLEQALMRLWSIDPGLKQRALSDYYKSALNRPIVETGELPSIGECRIPDLRDGA